MLDGLERDKVVERRESQRDRRVTEVRLTEKGHELVRERGEHLARRRRMIFESLAAEEQRSAEPLLRRLTDAVDDL